MAAETTEAVDLAHRAYALMQEEGPAAIVARYDEFFAPELKFRSALVGEVEGEKTYVGRDGWEEYWDDFNSSFESFGLSGGTFHEDPPGTVLIELTVTVVGSGSGVPLKRGVVYVFRHDGQRFSEGQTFFELEDARRFAEEGA